MRIYVLGDLFVIQQSGVPIGGPLSTMCLETVLARLEYLFDTHSWSNTKYGRALPGLREEWVTLGRYADDIIAVSRWLCHKCLKSMVSSAFPRSGVVFEDSGDVSSPSPTVSIFKYLDVTWILDCNCLIPTIQSPNLVQTVSGSLDAAKCRFIPNAFSHRDAIMRLVADISGRAARWTQIAMGDNFIFQAILLDTAEFVLAGYPMVLIDDAWGRCRGARLYRSLFTRVKSHLNALQAVHAPLHSRSQILSPLISAQLDHSASFASDLADTLCRLSREWCAAMGRGGDSRGGDSRGGDSRGGNSYGYQNQNQREWRDNRQPYQGKDKGQPDPLCKLASDFQNTLGSLKSLGEMCQLGQTLAAAGSSGAMSSGTTAAPAVSPEKGSPSTAALSDALVRILQGPSSTGAPPTVAADVSPAALVADQLRLASGGGLPSSSSTVLTQEGFEKLLNASPSFTKMDSKVTHLQASATEQKLTMERMASQQSTDSSTLAEILAAVRGNDGPKTAKTGTPPRNTDLKNTEVEFAVHKRFCEKYSISLTREYIKFDEYEHAIKKGVPLQRWEAAVARCKSYNQWITKLSAIFGEEAVANVHTTSDVLDTILAQEPDTLQP